jgi:hypothetical protein
MSNKREQHGDTGTRLHSIWNSMRARCNYPTATTYTNYGGSGIAVCEEWQSYSRFKAWAVSTGYADNLEIDRKDNRLGYSPDNCRWATRRQQAVNTRRTRGASPFRGVSRSGSKWRAQISDQQAGVRRGLSLGTFDTQIEAALAYDDKAFAMHGEFGVLNFPERALAKKERV